MPNNNPTGKGGLGEHPENINIGGRPKKYLTKLLEEIGNEVEPKSGKQFKELIARRTWIDALNGNAQARKEIFDRIEGLPQSYTEISTKDGKPLLILDRDGQNKPHGFDKSTTKAGDST